MLHALSLSIERDGHSNSFHALIGMVSVTLHHEWEMSISILLYKNVYQSQPKAAQSQQTVPVT